MKSKASEFAMCRDKFDVSILTTMRPSRSRLSCFCLCALLPLAQASLDPNIAELPSNQVLARANTLLASGQGSNALELFDHVVARDPSDYLTLYKRATAYLALSQSRKALEDFEAVLRLTEFDQVSSFCRDA